MQTTQLFLVRGRTGEVVPATEPLEDKWWPDLAYATQQWTHLGVLFGNRTPVMALAPYYAEHGQFCRYADSRFVADRYEFPSTAAYDAAYRRARPNAYGQGHGYVANAHVGNGLILRVKGRDRLLVFTSGRVVQYAVARFGPEQLVCDHPFLNGGRQDLGGRQYGLLACDPAAATRVALVAGTPAYSVYRDLHAGTMAVDPWGAIERHVTVYDAAGDTLDHRFVASAHDAGAAGGQYQKRLAYPNTVHVAGPPGHPSRLAWNLYQDGRWELHLSRPGATADELVLPGLFLWDVLARDGGAQLIVSPTPVSRPADAGSNGYFPAWRTEILAWDDAGRKLVPVAAIDDAIPHLLPAFREGDRTSTYGALYPVLRVRADGAERLLLERRDGRLFLHGR